MAMGSMRARCENRDGNAILAASGKVREETDNPTSNKLMIIFSDGCPAAINYGGQRGINHVRDVVRGLESSGWGVIQVGFGGATLQSDMFTNHIYVNDTNTLADKVGKIIRKVIKV
jgi:nitric oxide reductase activation protein